MIAFAFENLASRGEAEHQELGRHFEGLFFPSLQERRVMWSQGRYIHAYTHRAMFRENISLAMIRIRLHLASSVVLYEAIPNEHESRGFVQLQELLYCYVPRVITTHPPYRGIPAREYRRHMSRRLEG